MFDDSFLNRILKRSRKSDEVSHAERPVREKLPDFSRIPTEEACVAIQSQSGSLYSSILTAVHQANPGIPLEEIRKGLQELVGLQTVEDIFSTKRRIPRMPDCVKHRGKWVAILETHPWIVASSLMHLGACWVALHKKFGGLEGYRELRAKFVSEGGDPLQIDSYFVLRAKTDIEEMVRTIRAEAPPLDDLP